MPTRIASQLKRGDVGHAWLLLGPRGSGKRPVAIAMAAALNCQTLPLVGCGTCSSCVRILRSRHPDVHRIQPEGPLIPVDLIRETVIAEASRSPFEGHYKVFIIEEAERMNEAAQSSLLKSLEEPQPTTVFLLISDQEDDLLDTIRSRCRVLRLEPMSEARVVELLRKAGAPEATAVTAARLAEGDLERARALAFDPAAIARRGVWLSIPRRLASPLDALDAAGEIIAEAATAGKALEAAQKAEVVDLAEAMGEGRGTASVRNALLSRHKREARRLHEEVLGEALAHLASFYKDVVVARSGGREAVSNLDLSEELELWTASELSDGVLLSAVGRCLRARAGLPQNANPLLALEAAMVEIARDVPADAGRAAR
ncbi:MAG: DNA polymerase III subunit delta' [Actinomycetota bacterium]|nr:DNA polymerase III subunit delta' [Actinomycetota bacterium]